MVRAERCFIEVARCLNACIPGLGILLPRLQFPNTTQPPPREHHSAPSAPITPNHDTSGGSNHRPGHTSVRPRTQLARQQYPQTETTATEGAISCALGANHPAHDRNPQGNHHPSATEGAPQCTLGRNQPTGSCPQQRQPPARAQSHAPSTPITPPTATPNRANHHRGSSIAHPRRQLPPITTPKAGATTTEGAPPRTLDADYQAQQPQPAAQSLPMAHPHAPSAQLAH